MLLHDQQSAETIEISKPGKSTLKEAIIEFQKKHLHPPSRVYVSSAMTALIGTIKGVHIYYGSGLQENQVMMII